jgi:hypothetical protein
LSPSHVTLAPAPLGCPASFFQVTVPVPTWNVWSPEVVAPENGTEVW